MEKSNNDFDIPFYIFEEIVEYIEQTALGHCKTAKWHNIKALLGLARINNNLTKEQVDFLIKTYCRE